MADTTYRLTLTADEIAWLKVIVREKREFYLNSQAVSYDTHKETARVVEGKIADALFSFIE